LDKLDTLTLRKLQKYVDNENRKRPAAGGNTTTNNNPNA